MTLPLTPEGFLQDSHLWNTEVASILAQQQGILLTPAHWEIIDKARDFYHQYQMVPSMRPLVRYIANTLGKDKGNSLYLMRLFPQSPALIVACIAGLPRPNNCF